MIALLVALTVMSSASASPAVAPKSAKAAKKLPTLLQEVESKYSSAATLWAEFTQVNEISALNQKKTSSGVIQAKKPGKIRWETLKPDPNLLVSDGLKFWFYTPPFDEGEHGQVVERKSSDVQSKLAHALLQGSFSIASDMEIRQESTSLFTLTPKKKSAGTVIKAQIEVDPKDLLIRKVILEHRGGNRSEISLSNIELGKDLGDDIFAFQPPPGTDRINP